MSEVYFGWQLMGGGNCSQYSALLFFKAGTIT